jgi:DNA-binding IscR family transcriptional regulator
MENNKPVGKIKVVDIVDNLDGSCSVTFEADEQFKKWFKKTNNLKKWSQRRFNTFIQNAIDHMAARLKEEEYANKEEKKKN